MKELVIIFFLLVCFGNSSQAFKEDRLNTDSVIQKQNPDDHFRHAPLQKSYGKQKKKSINSFHEHRGFHLELNIGPAFGKVTERLPSTTGYDEYDFTGPGAGIDVKIGGAVERNFCLTFDILSKNILAPDIDKNGISYSRATKNSIGESTYGVGFTYFFVTDLFFSTTIGIGTFAVDDSVNTLRTGGGFSMQLRFGKHWWISQKWGISVGGTYGFTSVNNLNETRRVYDHDIKSDRFTIMAGIILH